MYLMSQWQEGCLNSMYLMSQHMSDYCNIIHNFVEVHMGIRQGIWLPPDLPSMDDNFDAYHISINLIPRYGISLGI